MHSIAQFTYTFGSVHLSTCVCVPIASCLFHWLFCRQTGAYLLWSFRVSVLAWRFSTMDHTTDKPDTHQDLMTNDYWLHVKQPVAKVRGDWQGAAGYKNVKIWCTDEQSEMDRDGLFWREKKNWKLKSSDRQRRDGKMESRSAENKQTEVAAWPTPSKCEPG